MNTHLLSLRPALTRALLTLLSAAMLALVPTARGQVLYVAQAGGPVGTYNATTGAAINANLVSGLIGAFGIDVTGNTLYVADHLNDKVRTFDATTGAAISSIDHFTYPLDVLVSGNDLFVVEGFAHRVNKNGNQFFITGLHLPDSVQVFGTDLFVSNQGGNVGRYNATTGAVINENFIVTPGGARGIKISGNDLYVVGDSGGTLVGRYNATTGAAINANLITGLNGANDIEILGNDLFVSDSGGGNRVGRYDATTGAAINPNFITGLNYGPTGLAIVVPEPGTMGLALLGVLALLRRRRVR